MVADMTQIKSEDGLTHGWDRSDTDEWAGAPSQQTVQLAALVLAVVALLIIVFIGPASAPYTIPAMLVAAALYVGTVTRKAQR